MKESCSIGPRSFHLQCDESELFRYRVALFCTSIPLSTLFPPDMNHLGERTSQPLIINHTVEITYGELGRSLAHDSWNLMLQTWNRCACMKRRSFLVQRKEPMTNSVESGMAPLNLNGPVSSEEHHKFMDWLIRRDVIAGSASPVLKWHLEGNVQAS